MRFCYHFVAIYAVLSRRHDWCKIRAFPGTFGVVPRHFQLLLMSAYGSNDLTIQHQKSFPPSQANPGKPDQLVSQNHPSSGVSSPLQCCSIEANIGHPRSTIQHAQGLEMSHSPDILGRSSQPVHGLVHPPPIDHIHQLGLRTNFPGIVPVSSFFTPVQSGPPHEV